MRKTLLLPGVIAVAALAVPLSGQAGGSRLERARQAPVAHAGSCWARKQHAAFPAPPGPELGPAFAGLRNSYRARLCAPDPRLRYGATLMPGDPGTNTVPYSLSVYGTCHARSGAGCVPPLAVETWPVCADNLSASSASGGFDEGGEKVSSLESLLRRERPWLLRQTGMTSAVLRQISDRLHTRGGARLLSHLKALTHSVPVSRSTDGTTLLKVYTGSTTTEIYAASRKLADRVGAAIAVRALGDGSRHMAAARVAARAYGAGCGFSTRRLAAERTNFRLVTRVGLTSGYTHHSPRCLRTTKDIRDPINVVWYGPKGGPSGVSVQSINKVLAYIGYPYNDEGGIGVDHQYVLTWPGMRCEREGAMAATLCSTCDRDHMRLFATYITGYGDPYHVVADVHQDITVICKRHVGGVTIPFNAHVAKFLAAKRRLVATWIAHADPYKSGIFWRRWRNTQPVRQCNGWLSADNGFVAFIP